MQARLVTSASAPKVTIKRLEGGMPPINFHAISTTLMPKGMRIG